MKGNAKVLDYLNVLLAEELTAINQYMVHSEMCADWGYGHLHEAIEKRAIQEMKHAETLIGRIIFLEGSPTVSTLNKITIGENVKGQFENDRESEIAAVQLYNEGVKLAREQSDNGTQDMLIAILKDEENHLDWLETQLDQIDQMGIQNYLVEQVD